MRVSDLHPWTTSYHEAVRIQNRLRGRLILRGGPRRVRLVAGADVSYNRGDDRLFAAVVVLQIPGMEIVEVSTVMARASFPYIPGLLSFREAPPLVETFRRLQRRPDAVIFDAQGIAHPRRFGLASHLGLLIDLPSIGCAKSRLIGEGRAPGFRKGSWTPLRLEGRRVGAILRTRERVNPVYVSSGHRMGLPAAIRIVLGCATRYRLPEPTRQAHIAVNRLRRAEGEKDHGSRSRKARRPSR